MSVTALPQRRDQTPVPSLSIGQVLSRLADDFPELSPSKLRFLEDRDLIHPARTASGYRSFSVDDIERIKLVLLMQRDHYLPLKVIRRYLADVDAGRDPAWPGTPAGAPSILSTERRLSRDELIADAGATAELLDDAITTGLIVAADTFGEDAQTTLRALTDLARDWRKAATASSTYLRTSSPRILSVAMAVRIRSANLAPLSLSFPKHSFRQITACRSARSAALLVGSIWSLSINVKSALS